MNELARLTSFHFEGLVKYRITDRNGNSWFIVKDVCSIIGIKNYRDAVSRFPDNEKGVVITDTLGGPQKTLIISEEGVFRLLRKSKKPVANQLMDHIGKLFPLIRKHGLNWAALPRNYVYRGKEITWGEWVNKKPEEAWEKVIKGEKTV
jgi:anti-repressor protein